MTSTTPSPATSAIDAEYYAAVPDGVIRQPIWSEACRLYDTEYETLGRSTRRNGGMPRAGTFFGYNRAEGEAETLRRRTDPSSGGHCQQKRQTCSWTLAPKRRHDSRRATRAAEDTRQMDGAKRRGHLRDSPWNRAEGETKEGIPVRFTSKGPYVYALLLGIPKSSAVTLKSVRQEGLGDLTCSATTGHLLGRQQGEDVRLSCPLALGR